MFLQRWHLSCPRSNLWDINEAIIAIHHMHKWDFCWVTPFLIIQLDSWVVFSLIDASKLLINVLFAVLIHVHLFGCKKMEDEEIHHASSLKGFKIFIQLLRKLRWNAFLDKSLGLSGHRVNFSPFKLLATFLNFYDKSRDPGQDDRV